MVTEVLRPRILGLILDVKTRWNSTFSMAKRFVDLRPVIEMYLMTDTKLKVKFSETEWALLKD